MPRKFANFTDQIPDPNKPGSYYKFTDREKMFVYHYLTDAKFCATEAAKLAGYDGNSQNSFRVLASNVKRKPKILAAINLAMETLTMPAYETLYRIGLIASGKITDVMNADGELDIDLAKKHGTDNLIKKIKRERTILTVEEVEPIGDIDEDGNEIERRTRIEKTVALEKVSFEIHDPLRALELLGKHKALFVERVEATGRGGSPLIPEGAATVTIMLPDNGRGDTTGLELTKPAQRAAKREDSDD